LINARKRKKVERTRASLKSGKQRETTMADQSVAQKMKAAVEAATVFADPETKMALRKGMEGAAPELREAREKEEKEAREAKEKEAKAKADEAKQHEAKAPEAHAKA
jgi:hypothetical protein